MLCKIPAHKKLNKKDREIQVNYLIYRMGAEAEKILTRFKFDAEADANDYEKVLKKFDEHFVPRNNVVYERACFRRRVQKAGETVEAYVRDRYHIVNKCEYDDRDEQIRDQLIFGIQDKELSRKLQFKPNITVEKAVDMAMYSETVTHQVAAQGKVQALDEIAQKGKGKVWSGKIPRRSKKEENSRGACTRCDSKHEKGDCPAKGKQCNKCNKTGHFVAVCRKVSRKELGHYTAESSDEVGSVKKSLFLGELSSAGKRQGDWQVNLKINGKVMNFKIDTGADITVISEKAHKRIPKGAILKPQDIKLISPGGKPGIEINFFPW
ncbi:uncharacterized protein [Ptychodera flava]|uniref:uncharacterized protein n=1 Tax=Ptychodera flava TaxID=63121 RepID=UPI00396A374E